LDVGNNDILIKVRANAVDVYLNDNGVGFSDRGLIANTPVHPNGSSRVTLVDIDGSGTPDLLWGAARNYEYIDLTGGVQPYVLKRVRNGLGASTELEYSTSTQLMLKAMTTADKYKNPVFDGNARDFLGFRNASVRHLGDANSPTSVSHSEFLLGHWTDDAKAVSEPEEKEPWRAAVKGLPVIEEESDELGTYRFTRFMSVAVKSLYTGLDNRKVYARPSSTVSTFAYDTANFVGGDNMVDVTAFTVEEGTSVTHTGTVSVPKRASTGTAKLVSSSSQDAFGNVTLNTKEGCVEGCPNGVDPIVNVTSIFGRPTGDLSGWLWRETESYITGSNYPAVRHRRGSTYNDLGEVIESHAWLNGTQSLQRRRESLHHHRGIRSRSWVTH
jgi:hypothetical protein